MNSFTGFSLRKYELGRLNSETYSELCQTSACHLLFIKMKQLRLERKEFKLASKTYILNILK